LIVYFCVISGYFILEQLKPVLQTGGQIINTPAVFVDTPGF